MHNEERKFGVKFAAQRAQEQFDLDGVGHYDAEQFFDVGTRYSETVVNSDNVVFVNDTNHYYVFNN